MNKIKLCANIASKITLEDTKAGLVGLVLASCMLTLIILFAMDSKQMPLWFPVVLTLVSILMYMLLQWVVYFVNMMKIDDDVH